jgi:hypothetical protein
MQLEKIQQWCAVADLDLVEVLRDVDTSGKDFDVRGRPAFDELMRRLEGGEAEAVVVYRMSRFGRDFYETVRTVRRLRERGVVFHSASERIDLESANGRLMFTVLASFDEYELDIRREYWAETKARVMRGARRAPRTDAARLPTGVEPAEEGVRRDDGARRPSCCTISGALVPDPIVGPVVRRAFELRAGGASVAEVVALLNREAVRTDGRRWTSTPAPCAARGVASRSSWCRRRTSRSSTPRRLPRRSHRPRRGAPAGARARCSPARAVPRGVASRCGLEPAHGRELTARRARARVPLRARARRAGAARNAP